MITNLFLKETIIPVFMVTAGIAISGIWTADILKGKFSGQGNFFRWREGANLLWPHILAEYLTGCGLIVGGAGLWFKANWALSVSLVSLGALIYSAINSSGWVLAEKDRFAYGIPMWISLLGAIIAILMLF
jgi:hypothetical protein